MCATSICAVRESKRGKAEPLQQAEVNGDGGNGTAEKDKATAEAGVERGVDEGQDVYVSGGNNDAGKCAWSCMSLTAAIHATTYYAHQSCRSS